MSEKTECACQGFLICFRKWLLMALGHCLQQPFLKNSHDGTLQLLSTTVIAYPDHVQPHFWQIEQNSGHDERYFGAIGFSHKNDVFCEHVHSPACKS